MLKVSVTEKDGTERVLFFEDNEEVSIGRLQTNRVALSKPNVSKRHAVLTVRDGRVFIEDLGSTNGTYVNGRRIMAVREVEKGDRIYIGDFTIRARQVSSREEKSEPGIIFGPPLAMEEQRRPTVAMAVPHVAVETATPELSLGPGSAIEMPPMPPPNQLSGPLTVPLDLDIEVVTDEAPLPTPPPSAAPTVEVSSLTGATGAGIPVASVAKPSDLTPMGTVAGPSEAPSLMRRFAKAGTARDTETDRHMATLKAVAEVAAKEVFWSVPADQVRFSDDEWQVLSDKVLALLDRMRRDDRLPPTVDAYQVTQDILFDFAGLGPLEELLQDPMTRRILINGPDRIWVTRAGQTTRSVRTFLGSTALDRVLAKLFVLAGLAPDSADPVSEVRLPDGTHMMVLRPPLVSDHVVIMLNRPAGSLLDALDLVQAGVMSQEVLDTLDLAVRNHRNVVICGAPNTGKTTFLNAVARLLPEGARVVVIERSREIVLTKAEAIRLSKEHLSCDPPVGPCVVSRLLPDAVIISDIDADDARLVTALGLTGQKGILASLTATSTELCLQRLEMLIAFGSPTVDADIIRSFVRNIVDLIVVLDLDPKGRSRVKEVSTLEKGEPQRIV